MIIPFLQSLYDQNAELPVRKEIYHELIEDIKYFSIEPQVYQLLKQQEKLNQTPLFFREHLKTKANHTLLINLFLKGQLEKILGLFESSRIDVIPLKGVLFAENYFGHIAARPTSDIDLLIKKPDLQKVKGLFKEAGFTYEEDGPIDHFHCSFIKELPGSAIPIVVEIHWDLLKENTSNLEIENFWRNAKPYQSYNYTYELSEQHTFYMIVLHAWRHNLDSLKHFLDIMQLIEYLNVKISYKTLFQQAATEKTLRRVLRTLSIVYKMFPVFENKIPLSTDQNLGKWWMYKGIREKDYRGLNVYLNYFDYLLFSYDKRIHSRIAFKEWLDEFFYYKMKKLRL